jgi:hypothetical protein
LVARFGVAADERFAVVLNNITKTRRQRYNAAYRARPQDAAGAVAQRLARAAYMQDYRACPRSDEEVKAERAREGGVYEDEPGEGAVIPAQEAKAEVYKELGYRLIGMVGQDLTVARPMVKAKGHIVQVIGPGGNTVKTLYRHRK